MILRSWYKSDAKLTTAGKAGGGGGGVVNQGLSLNSMMNLSIANKIYKNHLLTNCSSYNNVCP